MQGFVALARAKAGDAEEADPFEPHIFDFFFSPKVSVSKRARRVRPEAVIEIPED